MNLLIDTNIFRANPKRDKGEFQALERLAKSGHVRLYIPYFVQREFITARTQNYREELKKIFSGARGIKRKGEIPFLKQLIDDIENTETGELEEKLSTYLEEEFNEWIDNIKGTRLKVEPTHGQRVSQDYFAGNRPFKHRKSRDDIPDSFIWQNIVDLLENVDHLNVISNDGTLYKACEAHDQISAFDDLIKFIELDKCQEWLREGRKEENIRQVEQRIPLNRERIFDLIEEKLPKELMLTEVYHKIIPSDDNRGFIFTFDQPTHIELEESDIFNIGQSDFIMPFSAKMRVELNYSLFKQDLIELEEDRIKKIYKTERNRHYYSVDEWFTLDISGLIVLLIDEEKIKEEKMSKYEIDKIIRECKLRIDSYKVNDINH